MVEFNKYNENAYTGEDINEAPIESGNIHIDLNHDNKPKENLPFDFYNMLEKMYVDINNETRLDFDRIFCTTGHPSKTVKNPEEGRYYYDVKNLDYYQYSQGVYEKIVVGNEVMLMDVFY